MLPIINNVLLLLIVTAAFPMGYIIGTYTESEVEAVSKAVIVPRIFNAYFVLAESIFVTILFLSESPFYIVTCAGIMIINVILVAFHSALKTDLSKIIGYGTLFLVITQAAPLIMLLL